MAVDVELTCPVCGVKVHAVETGHGPSARVAIGGVPAEERGWRPDSRGQWHCPQCSGGSV